MLKFNSLTNVRPTKDLGSQIIASPTPGQFKVTPDAAKALGVVAGDYVQLVDAEVDGETKFFAVAGSEELGGGKLGSTNKTGGGVLTFSGAKAWDDMGGDANYNTMFDLDEENAVEQEGRTYFPLTSAGKEEKQKRKSSKEDNGASETASETPAEAPIQEATSFDDI